MPRPAAIWRPRVDPEQADFERAGRVFQQGGGRQRCTDQPISAKQLAMSLPEDGRRQIACHESRKENVGSCFALIEVESVHRDYWHLTPHAEGWLRGEWPRVKASRPNIAFRPYRRTPGSRRSSNTPNSAGGSCATIGSKKLDRDGYDERSWRGFYQPHDESRVGIRIPSLREGEPIPPSGVKAAILDPPLTSRRSRAPASGHHATRCAVCPDVLPANGKSNSKNYDTIKLFAPE